MKDKMEKFNEDEELRLAAYNRELNKIAHVSEIEEAKEISFKEGKLEEKMNFIQARYGQVEPEWLETLNEKQLDRINNIIFKESDYEKFKQEVEGNWRSSFLLINEAYIDIIRIKDSYCFIYVI